MMKSLLLVCALLSSIATTTFAQAWIGIFSDPQGVSCVLDNVITGIVPDRTGTNGSLQDAAAGLTFYVVHVNWGRVTSCEFKAPKPACLSAALVYESSPFPHYVTPGGFVHVDYGVCRERQDVAIHVYTLYYQTTGAPQQVCCYYDIVPGGVTDCGSPPNTLSAVGLPGIVNKDSSCDCMSPIDVGTTTWGRVKSLYTE